ncbi:unnamed protein product [Echinostoma caproni]|uniref:Secreted protein n=1 Tax=Echinostoma caproni TaxID=27848 RepID=A0A183AIF9_9TREM|nr:unnamed protein product [Echinostoma caproni]
MLLLPHPVLAPSNMIHGLIVHDHHPVSVTSVTVRGLFLPLCDWSRERGWHAFPVSKLNKQDFLSYNQFIIAQQPPDFVSHLSEMDI